MIKNVIAFGLFLTWAFVVAALPQPAEQSSGAPSTETNAKKSAQNAIDIAAHHLNDNVIASLNRISSAAMTSQTDLSEAARNLAKSLRGDPSQMFEVIPDLPRLIVLDGQKQVLEILKILMKTDHVTTPGVLKSVDTIIDALSEKEGSGQKKSMWSNHMLIPNVFEGFNNVFSNLINSAFSVVRFNY